MPSSRLLDIPLYGSQVLIAAAPARDLPALFKRKGLLLHPKAAKLSGDLCAGFTAKTSQPGLFVCALDPEYADLGTCAHEAVHVATYALRYAGVRHKRGDDETLAYLTGWLTPQLYALLS